MNEIFSKLATQTDVKSKFSVPVRALQFLPDFGEGHVVDVQVRDNTEHLHNIRCSIRREGHPKPVFSAGWLGFVHRKDVRVGDMIIFIFEEDDASGVHYRIRVQRRIIFLGAHVWADV